MRETSLKIHIKSLKASQLSMGKHDKPLYALPFLFGEFDSGSERTLAAWIRHASRTVKESLLSGSVAQG